MLTKLFLAFTIAATAVTASPSLTRRSDTATCDYVFIPGVPVDPATTNCVADFNYITGRSLAIASGGMIFGPGSTFTENPDDVFNVHNTLSAEGWTCEQTKTFLESLAGTSQPGPSGVNWLIQSVVCTCDD